MSDIIKDCFYVMEDDEEEIRLTLKTDPVATENQVRWCGIRPGQRILDAGCGPGKTTSIISEIVQPGGLAVGVDFSERRIDYAKKNYGGKKGVEFFIRDLRDPIELGEFDAVWVRFLLEHYRTGSIEIIKNLKDCLKPGGYLCLLDLDHNSMNHYELPEQIEKLLPKILKKLEKYYNFDPYSGRKLFSYLYDNGFENIEMDIRPHHLIYGDHIEENVFFNWSKKLEVISNYFKNLLAEYPGGYNAFYNDFKSFLLNPRRFTYTPIILCKGQKPSEN